MGSVSCLCTVVPHSVFSLGLSTSEIDTKLSSLKVILCGTPDCVLLDYLLKADLNIDAAINLHFKNAPSPSSTHNNVCNKSGNRAKEQRCAEPKAFVNNSSNCNTSSILTETNTNDQRIILRKRKWEDVDNQQIIETPPVNKRRRNSVNDEHNKENAINYQSIKHSNSHNTNNKENEWELQQCSWCLAERKIDQKSPRCHTPDIEEALIDDKRREDKEIATDFVNNIINSSSKPKKINGCSVVYLSLAWRITCCNLIFVSDES